MKLNLFTVEEANRLLSEIRPRFERLVEAKRDFLERAGYLHLRGVFTEAEMGAVSADAVTRPLRKLT